MTKDMPDSLRAWGQDVDSIAEHTFAYLCTKAMILSVQYCPSAPRDIIDDVFNNIWDALVHIKEEYQNRATTDSFQYDHDTPIWDFTVFGEEDVQDNND